MASTKQNSGIVKLATNHYSIRVRATCPRTGDRKELRREQRCTLTEARALQHEWRDELIESLATKRPERERLRAFVTSWIAGRLKDVEYEDLKLGTAKHIASIWDIHIAPTTIADLFVDDITPEDVQAWIDGMKAKTWTGSENKRKHKATPAPKRYGKNTIKGCYNKLRQIIRAACAKHRIPNPIEGVTKPPESGKTRKNYLRGDEMARVVEWIKEHEPNWYAAVVLDLSTALRWSELSALKFEDLDEDEGVIRVVRNQYKGLAQDSTKTGEDADDPRVVPLMPEVAAVLREHRQKLIKEQHRGLAEGWIFATRAGKLHKGSPLSEVLARACKACGTKLRISGHGIRHTSNDLLRRVASGVVTRSIVGHSSEEMNRRYSHVDSTELMTAASAAFAGVLGVKGVAKGVPSK